MRRGLGVAALRRLLKNPACHDERSLRDTGGLVAPLLNAALWLRLRCSLLGRPSRFALVRLATAGFFSSLLVLGVGCAQTVVRPQVETRATRLPRPGRVLVYDFATSVEDIHPDQDLLQQVSNRVRLQPGSAGGIGAEVASVFAEELVARIQALGLRAERAVPRTPVYPYDVEVVGAFVDIDQGNRVGRLVIGFGRGQAQMDTEVEVLQVSPRRGRWRVAQFATHADSGELPGAAVTMGAGAAVSRGMSAGTALGSAATAGGKMYLSDTERMAARSADQAAGFLARLFTREDWIAPPSN